MNPNWFIALPASADGWYGVVPDPPPGLRAFHSADLHFTVAFLGAVTEGQARAAWDAARWPLGPREVALGAVVPMGDPRRYSALSAVLTDAEVDAAIGACRAPALAAAGAPPDRYPPKAHLTLARPKRSATDAERAAGLTWAAGLSLDHVRLTLDRLALYTWSDERKERLFQVVAARALT